MDIWTLLWLTIKMLETKPPKIELGTNHSLKKEVSKKFNCTQCDSSYSNKSHLSEHLDSKHNGIMFADMSKSRIQD